MNDPTPAPAPPTAYEIAKAKLSALIQAHAPMHVGRDMMLKALIEGAQEFEAAVREDERNVLTQAGGAPLLNPTGPLDTSEADAVEPPRESTHDEVAAAYPNGEEPLSTAVIEGTASLEGEYHADFASPPMSDEELSARDEAMQAKQDAENEDDEGDGTHPNQLSPLS